MDKVKVLDFLTALGIPAAITTLLTVLGKTLSDTRQRNSKEALLGWLTQASATEPFEGDGKALLALHELRQSLVFERAFGLKTESKLRNELLLVAESQRESMRFQEVLKAGRLVSKLSLARLHSPMQRKMFKFISQISKPLGYLYISLGYIIFIVGIYLPDVNLTPLEDLTAFIVGLVLFGGLMLVMGFCTLNQGRRFEIAAAFLGWRSENQHSSLPVESEQTTNKSNPAASRLTLRSGGTPQERDAP